MVDRPNGQDGIFLNYERSWLQFNHRVLHEATRPELPVLERVRFISIVCSNLDEFFQKRVGGLKRQLMAGVTTLSVDGMTPEEQLAMIRGEVLAMMDTYRRVMFEELMPLLEANGIRVVPFRELNDAQKLEASRFFEQKIYPVVTPLAVDEGHPFPFISNKSRSLAIKLREPGTKEVLFARIKIPTNFPRWIELGGDSAAGGADERVGSMVLVSIDDLIQRNIARFFPGMEVVAAHLFRVTRNADLERNEEEAEDLLEMIEEELRERRFSEIVRMEIDAESPPDMRSFLMRELEVRERDVYDMRGPIGLADVSQIANLPGFDHLRHKPWVPAVHPALRSNTAPDDSVDLFAAIRKGFLTHHPYHSFESSTQRFVEQAASDPDVLAIKQTLYRTSSDSQVMHALIRAAESGKQVAVLVELKARFDEQQNITWAHRLEKAGVHVSYGIAGLKIHSKLTIVVREEQGNPKRYVHIGTGNYHPKTAQLYEDFGFFTCDEQIASDVTDLFNMLTGYAPRQTYKKLVVAPIYMRSAMLDRIAREVRHAEEGREARIVAKMNNLEDPDIIRELYRASQAGVRIDLIVRSVCRLIPGVQGLSEGIRVRSVIGRFLEHSRVFHFLNAGNEEFYLGSADWMHRNLDARVEAVAPITDPALQAYLRFFFETCLKDNRQSWELGPDGEFRKRDAGSEEPVSCQEEFMKHAREHLPPNPVASGGGREEGAASEEDGSPRFRPTDSDEPTATG